MSRPRQERRRSGLDLHPAVRRGGTVDYRVRPHYIQARKAAEHPKDNIRARLIEVRPGRVTVDVGGQLVKLGVPESRLLVELLGGEPEGDGSWRPDGHVAVIVSRRWSLLRLPVDSRTDRCFIARWP